MIIKFHYNKNTDSSIFVQLDIDKLNDIQNKFYFVKISKGFLKS